MDPKEFFKETEIYFLAQNTPVFVHIWKNIYGKKVPGDGEAASSSIRIFLYVVRTVQYSTVKRTLRELTPIVIITYHTHNGCEYNS